MLLPGSTELVPLAFRDTAYTLAFRARAASGDTVERERSRVTREERTGSAEGVLIAFRWTPPYMSRDSLYVVARGLVPVRERLALQNAELVIRYEGTRVSGTVQRGDSTPRPFAHTFAEPPFAFNEVELLVRSLPYRVGYVRVLPLYSEVDGVVEHDTVRVEREEPVPDGVGRAWRVRFADPAIVTSYLVDALSRRIVAQEVVQRRSGLRIRYVDAP